MIPFLGSIGFKVAALAVVGAAFVGGYFYIQSLRADIRTATENAARLEGVIASQKEQNEALTKSIAEIRRLNEDVNTRLTLANKDVTSLRKLFDDATGQRRDWDAIALKKPKLLEERLNIGTKYALRCNEIVTGAQLVPEDDLNNVCPELIKSRKPK